MGSSYYPPSGGGGVVDGQQIKRTDSSLFINPDVGLFAPDGETPWIDLSGITFPNFPIGLEFPTGRLDDAGIYLGSGVISGAGLFIDPSGIAYLGGISIGDNTGIAGSWDASGNLVAASITIPGHTLASLFDGSNGNVYLAQFAGPGDVATFFNSAASPVLAGMDGSGLVGSASNFGAGNATNSFDNFFASVSQSSSGSSNVFLQTNGDGSNLNISSNIDITDLAARVEVIVDTGWTANESAGDKTVAVQDYDSGTIDGMTTALNVVVSGFGTAIAALADQVRDLTKKFEATEAALAALLLPNT